MKDKFDFLIGNNVYGLITVSIVVLVIIAVAVGLRNLFLMYSIDFDESIIKGIELIDITKVVPHEKIISKKSSTLSSFLKSFNDYIIISSILCCSKSMVIIDGHHRYFTLKKLGFKKIPVTKIDYESSQIKTGITENYT